MSGKDGMKTLADVVAEWMPHFQKYADPHEESAGFDMAGDAVSALEEVLAASKLDGEMLKANIARVRELEGLLGGAADALLGAAIRRREGRTGTPRPNADAGGTAGNAAALRAALDKAENVILCAARFAEIGNWDDVLAVDFDGALAEIKDARSAPARNCDREDIRTLDDAVAAYAKEQRNPHDFYYNPDLCIANWLLSPAGEGRPGPMTRGEVA